MAIKSKRRLMCIWFITSAYLIRDVFSRSVNIEVQANWPKFSVSSLVEVSEFISDLDSERFWSYAEETCKYKSKIDIAVASTSSESAFDIQTIAYDASNNIIPSSYHSLLETTIEVGMYKPAVEFYRSVSESFLSTVSIPEALTKGQLACAVFITDGATEVLACNPQDFQKQISHIKNKKSDGSSYVKNTWEHTYPSKESSQTLSLGHVVLYGIIGSSSFCALHTNLKDFSDKGILSYSFRHSFFGLKPLSNTSSLHGYGVYLDIKNMEYKNVDDTKSSPEENDEKSNENEFNFPVDEEIEGFNFAKILERNPELGPQLSKFREELLKESDEGTMGTEMKVWRMKDLGVQAVQAIIDSTDRVGKLIDIVQNFPQRAAMLPSVKVSAELREELMGWQGSGISRAFPSDSVYINGLRVDLSSASFNAFDFLSLVKMEYGLLSGLDNLRLSKSVRERLRDVAVGLAGDTDGAASMADGDGGVRIDVSKGGKYVIHFLNNLEKDPQYRRMSRSVQMLLYPSWQLQAIAKNLYTLVAVIDPLTGPGASLVSQIMSMYQQQYPIRFGFVLSPGEEVNSTTEVDTEAKGDKIMTSADVARFFAYVKETSGAEKANAFIQTLCLELEDRLGSGSAPEFTASDVLEIFQRLQSSWSSSKAKATALSVLLNPSNYSDFVHNCTEYISQRGLPVNSFSLNGMIKNSFDVMNNLMSMLGKEQFLLGQLVQRGLITDSTRSIFNVVLSKSKSYPRYHPLVEEDSPVYLDLTTPAAKDFIAQTKYLTTPVSENDAILNIPNANTTYLVAPLTPIGLKSVLASLNWLTTSAARGRHRLSLIPHLASKTDDSAAEVLAVVIYSVQMDERLSSNEKAVLLTKFISSVIGGGTAEESLVTSVSPLVAEELLSVIRDPKGEKFTSILGNARSYTKSFLKALEAGGAAGASVKRFSFLEVSPAGDPASSGVTIAVYNARVLRHTSVSQPMYDLDFSLLSEVEQERLGKGIEEILDVDGVIGSNLEGDDVDNNSADDLQIMASFCGRYSSSGGSRVNVEKFFAEMRFSEAPSSFILDIQPSQTHDILACEAEGSSGDQTCQNTDASTPNTPIEIIFVINPLSLAGQRAAGLIQLVQDNLRVPQKVVLSPNLEISEFPLQSFYRHSYGANTPANFKGLPRQHVLTVRVDTPELWNVQANSASQDIDNLRCDTKMCGDKNSPTPDTSRVAYTLKSLLVAGQCFDKSGREGVAPPAGLQITLSRLVDANRPNPRSTYWDTLVMNNLGYYQLQAQPGLWRLSLAEGRARHLYSIDVGAVGTKHAVGTPMGTQNLTIEGNKLPEEGVVLPVNSFSDRIVRLMVTKRPGMEGKSLLDSASDGSEDGEDKEDEDEGDSGSVWNTISNLFGSTASDSKDAAATRDSTALTSASEDGKIHVFSLATGHLYERLLRIMMLSVTKRASMPVKFWLFENYLSPTFKKIVEVMTKQYGFEVAYVTYKWPEWLKQQTQKQRIIWGYKILFLDVLFPLSVKKVIYVDADQVVRADLKELWDLNLRGKPYAYTPFCASREETKGFQFWRSGFWADHLRGLPYHISALYVVDLQKFRRMAVGDNLRAIYDNLAQDPNSLANLDQDLPNYAQHMVPIHSLPQEWLWCETWCSDNSKAKAKTIDLCNNPLHKEPKLDMAKRVISGSLFNESWVQLDEEIKSLVVSSGLSSEE